MGSRNGGERRCQQIGRKSREIRALAHFERA